MAWTLTSDPLKHHRVNTLCISYSQLMQEVAHIVCEISEPSELPRLLKRLQFMRYEFSGLRQTTFSSLPGSHAVMRFLFEHLQFRATENLTLAELNLAQCLFRRSAHTLALSVLAGYIAEAHDVQLCLLSPAHLNVWRTQEGQDVFYWSSLQASAPLNSNQLLSLLADHKSALPMTLPELRGDFLAQLRHCLVASSDWARALVVQNALLESEPANVQSLAERAMLLHRLGDHHGALCDLKRYFSFVDIQIASTELRSLFAQLNPPEI